jgi:dTMP kinase
MKPPKILNKGVFITFEGCEGSGKTTHSNILVRRLKKSGYSVVHTREPGGTKFAEAVRKLLLDPRSNITPLTELFLYEAARSQHISDIIAPALKNGLIVVCDRFTDATVAYQGYGRGISLKTINVLNRTAAGRIKPDLTIYLDIPVREGLKKARGITKDSFSAGPGGDRLEREKLPFHQRVRTGYLAQARREPRRIKVICIRKTVEQTAKLVENEITKCLSRI